MLSWAKKCSALLKNPEEPPEESGIKIPDVLDDANLYEWAGISFGKGELYRLYLSIKKLSESIPSEVEKLRLFGKINTRTRPYFVLEGLNTEDEEGVDESKQEGRSGANKYSYWVTQNIEDGKWTKLPNVTMDQIVKARLFRRFLTGDLDAPVPSYPPFAGTERNLLRTQIACIVGACSISPDGYFDLNEDDPPQVVPAEAEAMAERFPKSSSDLKDPEGWKHHEGELNRLGRVTAMPEQTDENGEVVEPEDPVEAATPLDAIKPEAWTFRVCPGGVGTSGSSAVVARSLVWPGAVAVSSGRKFVNIYVGNGLPYTATAYSPPLPSPIQAEWAAPVEEGVEGSGGAAMLENADVRVDPTPPKPAGEEEEE
jgi:radial spoke head protein 4/6